VKCYHWSIAFNGDENVKVKVKQSHYRFGVAQRGSRKLRFLDFMTTA
jgi:hypothetical protein